VPAIHWQWCPLIFRSSLLRNSRSRVRKAHDCCYENSCSQYHDNRCGSASNGNDAQGDESQTEPLNAAHRPASAVSGRGPSSPPPKFVVDGSGSEIPARECSAKTQFKTAKTENFRKRLHGTAAWLLCIRPSKFPKMIVQHVPITAGRKRIDTAIKTRCLNPTAAHRVAFRCTRSISRRCCQSRASLLRRCAQLALTNNPLVGLTSALYPVFKFAIAFRQSLGDDIRTARRSN